MVSVDSRLTLVIILGASQWPEFNRLGGSPAFKVSATWFRKYLRASDAFGLPDDNLLWLFDDPRTFAEIDGEVAKFLAAHAPSSRDLVVYYVGHGGFVGQRGDYFLALRSTREDGEASSGYLMSALAATVKRFAPRLRRFLILDACFAAHAAGTFLAAGAPEAAAARQTLDEFPRRGTSLLCASGAKTPARAPRGAHTTMFTGALLQVLRDAEPGQALSFDELCRRTWDVIQSRYPTSPVRPELHDPEQPDGRISSVPLFARNGSIQQPPGPELDDAADSVTRIASAPTKRPELPPKPVVIQPETGDDSEVRIARPMSALRLVREDAAPKLQAQDLSGGADATSPTRPDSSESPRDPGELLHGVEATDPESRDDLADQVTSNVSIQAIARPDAMPRELPSDMAERPRVSGRWIGVVLLCAPVVFLVIVSARVLSIGASGGVDAALSDARPILDAQQFWDVPIPDASVRAATRDASVDAGSLCLGGGVGGCGARDWSGTWQVGADGSDAFFGKVELRSVAPDGSCGSAKLKSQYEDEPNGHWVLYACKAGSEDVGGTFVFEGGRRYIGIRCDKQRKCKAAMGGEEVAARRLP